MYPSYDNYDNKVMWLNGSVRLPLHQVHLQPNPDLLTWVRRSVKIQESQGGSGKIANLLYTCG